MIPQRNRTFLRVGFGIAALVSPSVLLGTMIVHAATVAQHADNDATLKTYPVLRASNLIGREVTNTRGEALGTIQDLAIDVNGGSIGYAVLSSGVGDKLFAIPFDALHHGDDETCVLDIDQERLKNAPGFNPDHWPDFASPAWNSEVRGYYGVPAHRAIGRRMDFDKHRANPMEACTAEELGRLRALPEDAEVYAGTVTRMAGHQVTVRTGEGKEVRVAIAPSTFLAQQRWALREGDDIKVKAVSVPTPNGFDQWLVATEIQNADRVVTLRRDDGTPAWHAASDAERRGGG